MTSPGRTDGASRVISLRLPLDLLERIKIAANKRDVPYQSLIKVWLAEKVSRCKESAVPEFPEFVSLTGRRGCATL